MSQRVAFCDLEKKRMDFHGKFPHVDIPLPPVLELLSTILNRAVQSNWGYPLHPFGKKSHKIHLFGELAILGLGKSWS